MGQLLKRKCSHSPLNLRILSSTSVPFTLTTVQVLSLALTHKKRITVWSWARCAARIPSVNVRIQCPATLCIPQHWHRRPDLVWFPKIFNGRQAAPKYPFAVYSYKKFLSCILRTCTCKKLPNCDSGMSPRICGFSIYGPEKKICVPAFTNKSI